MMEKEWTETVKIPSNRRDQASTLRKELSLSQRTILQDDLKDQLKKGAMLAWLSLVNTWRNKQKRKITHQHISDKVFVTREAVTGWFQNGNMEGFNLHALLRRFAGIRDLLSEPAVFSAGCRHAIGWIRFEILSERSIERLHPEDFELLWHDYQLNEDDESASIRSLPRELKDDINNVSPPHLRNLREKWGKSFSLFLLEMEGETLEL